MSKTEKAVHRLMISLGFSLLNWIIIDNLLVEISLWKYIFIELLLVFSMKFSIFTIRKLRLSHDSSSRRN